MRGPIRYAQRGVSIAYQVTGDGPFDLVLVPGFISHLEYDWEEPRHAAFLERLASFSRLIRLDKRGTGLSDRHAGYSDLEARMDDVRAVMDAVGTEHAALFGYHEGGPMSMLFAATYPERTRSLALFGTYAVAWTSLLPNDRREAILDDLIGHWGDGTSILFFWPEADGPAQAWWGVKERLAGSPEAIRSLWGLSAATDVRAALPTVQAPTLVLQRSDDRPEAGGEMRKIADSIPGARFVELAGSSALPWVDADPLVDEIEEFLTGARPTPVADRVLATILFTDIVGSTEPAREMGDSAWSRLIEQHHAAVRRELDRYAGEEIDTAGDGFFATFDGPARAIRCALEIQHAVSALGADPGGPAHRRSGAPSRWEAPGDRRERGGARFRPRGRRRDVGHRDGTGPRGWIRPRVHGPWRARAQGAR